MELNEGKYVDYIKVAHLLFWGIEDICNGQEQYRRRWKTETLVFLYHFVKLFVTFPVICLPYGYFLEIISSTTKSIHQYSNWVLVSIFPVKDTLISSKNVQVQKIIFLMKGRKKCLTEIRKKIEHMGKSSKERFCVVLLLQDCTC